jgi:hypothetical protein
MKNKNLEIQNLDSKLLSKEIPIFYCINCRSPIYIKTYKYCFSCGIIKPIYIYPNTKKRLRE